MELNVVRVKRRIAEYYLALRLSALAAMPIVDPIELHFPAPIVRQVPGYLKDGWDEREIVRQSGIELIVTRALTEPRSWSINPN